MIKKYGLLSILIGVQCVLIGIYYFFIKNQYTRLGLKKIVEVSGPFGDTIGGLFGPTIALIGSIYAIRAYRQQLQANLITTNELTRQNAQIFTNELTAKLNGIKYGDKTGVDAAKAVANELILQQLTPLSCPSVQQINFYAELSEFLMQAVQSWTNILMVQKSPLALTSAKITFNSMLLYYISNFYPTQQLLRRALIDITLNKDYNNDITARIVRLDRVDSIAYQTLDSLSDLKLISLLEVEYQPSSEIFNKEEIDFSSIAKKKQLSMHLKL